MGRAAAWTLLIGQCLNAMLHARLHASRTAAGVPALHAAHVRRYGACLQWLATRHMARGMGGVDSDYIIYKALVGRHACARIAATGKIHPYAFAQVSRLGWVSSNNPATPCHYTC